MREVLRRGANVLVTGGAGFIGAAVTRRLLAEEFQVRVLDDLSRGRRERLEGLPVELMVGDVRSERVAREAVGGMDAVIHLADRRAETPREERLAHEVNVTGTLHLLAAARDAQLKRFVYGSSATVYGRKAPHLLHEDITPNAEEIDGAFKIAAENYCRLFAARDGVPVTILRPFSVYGPEREEGLVACFVYSAIAGDPMVIEGDGTQTRDLIHVEDVAAAFVTTLLVPQAVGRTLNIASGEAVQVRTVAGMISALVGGLPPPRYLQSRPRSPHDIKASVAAAASTLGFRARIRLREGLAHSLGLGELPLPPLPQLRLPSVPPPPARFAEGSDTKLPAQPFGTPPMAFPAVMPPAATPASQVLFGDRPPSWTITDEAEASFGQLAGDSTGSWAR